ncbi:F-box protein [Cardamine amara subsp. amara]|uniref:F-box protein n=1 Tax=Cardamine amara subsp. amara TaxID=228776 RepID=A0ABD0ZST8_CARAN
MIMTRSKTRACSNSRNQVERSEPLPFDLVIEILLRLPVKSIARFRIVSKLWESTLASPNFTESFFTISSSRPNLLFTCLKDGETFFFSSSSLPPPIAAKIHKSFPINCPSNICRPVRGLVCGLNQRTSKGGTVTVPWICNPSTGQSLALPRVKTRRKGVISFFGYDPMDKHFKVLCMTLSYIGGPYTSQDHQVLTLETGKKRLSWRKIKCEMPHYPASVEQTKRYDGICINGVLYYLACITHGYFHDIACFDIRSEKFYYIKRADHGMDITLGAWFQSTLVNYKGKLAKLQPGFSSNVIYTSVQLWVLEDAEKHQWSSYIYVMPPPWRNISEENKLCFVGTTRSGEIVLSPNTIGDFFYLAYYKPERDTISIVGIKGMEAFKSHRAYTFLDHEEDVKLFSSVSNHRFVT